VTARIESVVTSGTFSLDGGTWDVDNNVWIVGDDSEVVIIDAAHDAPTIAAAVGDRTVRSILLTHGHNDHIDAALALRDLVDAPVFLHEADRMLWDTVHDSAPDAGLTYVKSIPIAGTDLLVLPTAGHSPGSTCFHAPELGAVFSGDTLFRGGPGATGRSYSDFPTILDSITRALLSLPEATRVLTGHGDETSVGAERPGYDEWVSRGH